MQTIEKHKTNVDIYLNNPVGIGEHPQHFKKWIGLVESIVIAR